MKKHLTLLMVLLSATFAVAQVDAITIASAKKAMANKDYQIALSTLNDVSPQGRSSKLYLYYKGYSHYYLEQYDSAQVYLKRYLIKNINDTAVTNTLADIDYKIRKKLDTENKKQEVAKTVQDKKEFIIDKLNNYSCSDKFQPIEEDGFVSFWSYKYSNCYWVGNKLFISVDQIPGVNGLGTSHINYNINLDNYTTWIIKNVTKDEYGHFLDDLYELNGNDQNSVITSTDLSLLESIKEAMNYIYKNRIK